MVDSTLVKGKARVNSIFIKVRLRWHFAFGKARRFLYSAYKQVCMLSFFGNVKVRSYFG